MKRKHLLTFVALVACISSEGALAAGGRLSFVGQVVQGTCSARQLQLGREFGGDCAGEGRRAIDMERMTPAPAATDSALLDYFIERAEGDTTFMLTRQYR
jgi:hypothetical protein